MMATSLAEQLKRLAVPQTNIYKDDKNKASFLFNPKEAATKDRGTFYEIGISGLKELIALYEGFRIYEDTLFSLSSKDFERAVQTKEINENLNNTIDNFLRQISPYLLLQSSHKALEWLVNRYHIHEYNQDAIMALILPYHETKVFVRFIQLMDVKNSSNRWNWLEPLQKKGVPLAKQVLYNQCCSNTATLQFIAKSTLKYVKVYGERASQLKTVFAFFCSTTIGTIETSKQVTEGIINALLPTLMKAMTSPVLDFRASAYVILGYLVTKATIKENTLNEIMSKLLNSEYDLTYDKVLLMNLIYSTQHHVTKILDVVLYDMTVDRMNFLCVHLSKLIQMKVNVQQFVLTFLGSTLSIIQTNNEEFIRFRKLPELLINDVDFKTQHPEKIIKCVIDAYQPETENEKESDESDLEIIDDDYSNGIIRWYLQLLKSLEQKYPQAFDEVIKKELSSKEGISKKRHSQLTKILGFKSAIIHKLGDMYLFENLNHINPTLRVEAVKYISNKFSTLKADNEEFLRESIMNRFNDENPEVVHATMEIPIHCLSEILNGDDLKDAFVNIMSRNVKNYKKWKPVVKQAIEKFCSLENLPVTQDTVLAILPHLFPSDEKSSMCAYEIITSNWGQRFPVTKSLNLKKLKNTSRDICNSIFRILCDDKTVGFDDILDFLVVNKYNTLDICFYLLLKSCTLDRASIEESTQFLNILLDSIKDRQIVSSANYTTFCGGSMSELVKLAREDKILFELMEFLFCRIIQDIKISDNLKTWCNLCNTPETVFIRRLFEIFVTGCSINSYSASYCKLLQKLLNTFCCNPEEKFEFIANIACGHILYASIPENVINPELQLRSLKLLSNYINLGKNLFWIVESDVIVSMILFNLNHPLTVIRECTISTIKLIIKNSGDTNHVYMQLLTELIKHEDEMILDHEQILQVLHTILTSQNVASKIFRKNCLNRLLFIINNSPPHVSSELIKLLSNVNNANVFSLMIPTLRSLQLKLNKNELDLQFTYDIYESKLMKNVFARIDTNTVSSFENEAVWSSISYALQLFREIVLEEDQTFTSPCVLIMKRINEETFKKIPRNRLPEIIQLICAAGTISNNPNIATVASKSIKKINLHFTNFSPILESMLNVSDPKDNVAKKKKSSLSMISYQVTETNEWKLGVTLLEYIQSKKKMSVDNSLMSLLFQLLKKCLRFEEQSYVEYTKQLILSSMWYYCKKFVDDSDLDQVTSLKSIFDIDIIVQCIRGTQNPQTHHHALILLSHAAYMLPEQVLHNTLEIFTFMGSSVLRHDDAYSFQIIAKIIETLIPILVKLDRDIEAYDHKEMKELQKRVVPVLRIFADVVLGVPEHRRLPLYKKLIETLNSKEFLWVLLALLLETHIAHWSENKDMVPKQNRSLAEQELPINRLDFGQSIILEFSPEVVLQNFVKLLVYAKSLPLQKDENAMDTDVDPGEIFSINGHTAVQLRHFKYIIITFMSTCLSSPRFITHTASPSDVKTMETQYKSLIVNILTFIQSISKVTDEKTAKYWRVMLHHSYDLLNHANNLLSASMFLSVVKGLLRHNLQTVRRKAMELLNTKIQFSPELFTDCNKDLLFSLLPALLDIVKTIEDVTTNENLAQELELNQQTALLSVKLLTRMLATDNPDDFKPVLECITEYTCNSKLSGNVLASVVLCLAELCGNLKANALSCLPKFMPALIKILKKQRKSDAPELILLSTVTAISKIVESLPLFLSPYLQKILYEYSILLAKWQSFDQECAKISAVVTKLSTIKRKIASSIPPRVLIPIASQTHTLLMEKENFDAIRPVMSVLAESFDNITTADFNALRVSLTSLFLSALELRCIAIEKNVDATVIDKSEDEVVNALVCLVLKLSETSFRPFYFKIYDWAIRNNVHGSRDRAITFYRLSNAISEKLKGLFVLFAGHFIKNAAELLDACNKSKTEQLFFESEQKCCMLVEYILKTLRVVFLYDSQNFLNKDRFETLMQPIVDQLENTLGGIPGLKIRATEILIPCLSQFAVAIADDSLWKLLNYQILLKTRHNDAEIRLTALECLVTTASQLGSSWLPLLAESVPFLAELLEDGDSRIEVGTKEAIRKLEQILGEPLEKYF